MMKQIGVLLSLLLFCISVSANDIVKIEYFFNSDPGYGNGTEIAIPSANSILNLDVNLPIESLDYGFNTAYFRALDDSGKWSLTSSRVFTKMNTSVEDNSIKRIEYFLDTDPGYGNATPVTFTETEGVIGADYTVDLTGLSKGFHNLYIRVQDNRGAWSITSRRAYYIFENESNHAISQIEYFIDADPGFGKGTALDFTEENGQVLIDHTIDIAGLDNGFHTLYIRTKDASGAWSITSKRAFFVRERENGDALPNIVGLEYYISNEDTTTNVKKFNFPTPKPFIDTADLVWLKDSLNLAFNQRYNLHVRAIDEKGNKSAYATDQFIFYDSIPEGDIPMDMWVPFTIEKDKPFNGNVYTGEIDNLFMFVKKTERIGYSGTWSGNIKLIKDEELISDYSGSPDFDKQLITPEGGFYDFEITTRTQKSSGFIKFTEYPDTLQLNEWSKGEILRPYGYDWKCFDVTEATDTIFIQTEGYGLWSTIEVFYEDINQKEEYWQFSNMGAGYAISGFIIAPKKGRYYFRYKDSAVLYDDDTNDKNTQNREYLIFIGANESDSIIDNKLKSISNLSQYQFGPGISSFEIIGRGFSEKDSVILVNKDSSLFYGCVSYLNSNSKITAVFDFSNIQEGEYNILLLGDTTLVHLTPIFVESKIKDEFEIEIISRDKFRVGRYQKSIVRITNKSNMGKSNLGVYISGIPQNAKVSLDIELSRYNDSINMDTIPLYEIVDEEIMIPLVVNYIPSGEYVEIPLSIYQNVPDTIDLDVIVDANFSNKFGYDLYSTETIFKEYYVIDSLAIILDSLIHQSKLKGSKLFDEEIAYYGQEIITRINNASGLQISEGCRNELNNLMTSAFSDATNDIVKGAVDLGVDIVYDVFFKDWADCFKGASNIAVNHFYRPALHSNKGFWETTKQIFSQKELFIDSYKTVMSCGVAVVSMNPLAKTAKAVKASSKAARYAYKANKIYRKPASGIMKQTARTKRALRTRNELNRWKQQLKLQSDVFEYSEKFQENGLKYIDYFKKGGTIGVSCSDDVLNAVQRILGVTSTTPEDKYGPTGHSTLKAGSLAEMEHYVDTNQVFEYRIDYWNKVDATAPAAIVYIRDTLDTDFDINTVNFTEIGFLKWKVKLDGGNYFNVNVDCRPDMPYIVNVEGTVDPETREVFWVHTTLDPETMELPEDPLSGYLPPIDSTGYQIGWVDYTVESNEDLPHGTVFENQAFVNFDGVGKWGPAPPYGPYKNTFDIIQPSSNVHELPETSSNDTISISWSGQDEGSGIASFTIFMSVNNGGYSIWKSNVMDTTAFFVGEDGNTYAFYSIAEDFVGNKEHQKSSYDAITTMDLSTGLINNSLTAKDFIHIYPNPSSCCFTLEKVRGVGRGDLKFQVIDGLGRIIHSGNIESDSYNLDLSNHPKGIYFLKVSDGTAIHHHKLLLE